MNTTIAIAAAVAATVSGSGWIAAWWQARKTNAELRLTLKAERHADDLTDKLVGAATMIRAMEINSDNPPSDTRTLRALQDALNLLPAADAQRIRLWLYEARRGEGAGGDTEHVSGTPGPAAIAELEDDEPG